MLPFGKRFKAWKMGSGDRCPSSLQPGPPRNTPAAFLLSESWSPLFRSGYLGLHGQTQEPIFFFFALQCEGAVGPDSKESCPQPCPDDCNHPVNFEESIWWTASENLGLLYHCRGCLFLFFSFCRGFFCLSLPFIQISICSALHVPHTTRFINLENWVEVGGREQTQK